MCRGGLPEREHRSDAGYDLAPGKGMCDAGNRSSTLLRIQLVDQEKVQLD